jgi:hydroxyethylthiazole kinase
MNVEIISNIRKKTAIKEPLVHCITNPISINLCANGVLAVGAKPIMAEHPLEVAEITKTADALMLNLGNITDARVQSIKISAEIAQKHNIPFIIDTVGIACSQLRRGLIKKLLRKLKPTAIKGNYSEIIALYDNFYTNLGVDADETLSVEKISNISVRLAQKYNTMILASGETDIITDGESIAYIHNGTPQLTQLTGTGCLLGALCCCYLSVEQSINSLITGCVMVGVCGQLSETEKGNGSFGLNLMDYLSVISDTQIEKLLDFEVKKL